VGEEEEAIIILLLDAVTSPIPFASLYDVLSNTMSYSALCVHTINLEYSFVKAHPTPASLSILERRTHA
jgi:hypothetical protein